MDIFSLMKTFDFLLSSNDENLSMSVFFNLIAERHTTSQPPDMKVGKNILELALFLYLKQIVYFFVVVTW